MKTQLTLAAAIAVGATGAFAGGSDRSGQPVAIIFEEGNQVEFSLGYVAPKVSGTRGATTSGNMSNSYTALGFGVKTDLTDKVALALIVDQPFGADVTYSDPSYILTAFGTNAQVNSMAFTILGKYQFSDRISAYAGPRIITADGTFSGPDLTFASYTSTYSSDTAVGYVLGAAYEIPDIALRAALTYSSSVDFAMDGTNGDLTASMPQSVNLDFQTGIAANTLLMASVRWADWSEAHITDSTPIVGVLTDYGNTDTFTYTLGVGRKFSEKFSGSATIGYEKPQGALTGNLNPTDGYLSLALGGSYDLGDGAKISGGVRYVKVGDATTKAPVSGVFTGNSAVAVGIKFSQSF